MVAIQAWHCHTHRLKSLRPDKLNKSSIHGLSGVSSWAILAATHTRMHGTGIQAKGHARRHKGKGTRARLSGVSSWAIVAATHTLMHVHRHTGKGACTRTYRENLVGVDGYMNEHVISRALPIFAEGTNW